MSYGESADFKSELKIPAERTFSFLRLLAKPGGSYDKCYSHGALAICDRGTRGAPYVLFLFDCMNASASSGFSVTHADETLSTL